MREERERREREEQERREREERERQDQYRRDMEENLRRQQQERDIFARRDEEDEMTALLESIKREQERLEREEQRRQAELFGVANGHGDVDLDHDHDDDFPWTQTVADMEMMERYEEPQPMDGKATEVSSFKLDINALKPAPAASRPSAYDRLPPTPPPSGSSKSRRSMMSPTPPVDYPKKVTFSYIFKD